MNTSLLKNSNYLIHFLNPFLNFLSKGNNKDNRSKQPPIDCREVQQRGKSKEICTLHTNNTYSEVSDSQAIRGISNDSLAAPTIRANVSSLHGSNIKGVKLFHSVIILRVQEVLSIFVKHSLSEYWQDFSGMQFQRVTPKLYKEHGLFRSINLCIFEIRSAQTIIVGFLLRVLSSCRDRAHLYSAVREYFSTPCVRISR